MSHASPADAGGADPQGGAYASGAPPEPTTGELLSRLSTDLSALVRDELRLAQVEATGKVKQAGVGAGMFGAAGILALYGAGVLVATAVLALALVLDAWLAALVVAVVLLAVAAVAALLGKKRVQAVGAPVPTQAVENVKADVDALKHPRDHH